NESNAYSLGGGYYKETAVVPGQDFTRYSLRATIDSKIGKKVKVGLSTLNSVGVTNGSQFVQYGTMFPLLSLSPLEPAYDANGSIRLLPAGNKDDVNGFTWSPLLLKHNNGRWVDQSRRLRTINSLYGEYEIIKGLKYRINLGLTFSQQEDDQFKGAYSPTNPCYFNANNGNTASVNNTSAWGYTAENLITYDKTIAQKHRISFTGLYSVQEFHQHNTKVSKDSITDDFSQFYALSLSNATPKASLDGGEQSWALLSYMARLLYVYNDKYMITITGRSDGSSRLAAGHKWHQYPAVSLGWNIANEGFMKNIKTISSLKLRAGFGQTSNQSINPYSSLGLVSNKNYISTTTTQGSVIRYNFGPSVVTGYNVINIPNSSLDWEYTKTYNLGLDFGVLNNRISGSIEYYNTTTEGVLYNVTLPATTGISGKFLTNVGSIKNYGFELTLSTKNVVTRSGFTWSTDFNLFANRNKVLSLSNQSTQDIPAQLFVGHSMTAIYDYKKLGIWQLNEAAQAAVYGAVPGQIKLKDYNNDGKVDSKDQAIIGTGDANIQGGMTNRFFFKGFDFSFNLYARFGGLLVSQIHQPGGYLTQMAGNRNQIKVDYWTPSNPTNWFPSPALSTVNPITTASSTLGYYDATFVKLRSINLGYTFSTRLLSKINLKSVRLYVTLDNVATLFSPYMKQTGIDPESTQAGSNTLGDPGNLRNNTYGNGMLVVTSGTPPSRTFSIGANISF
ncbi:MAG TPA: SusC/RagA family TonB-linked outer membrane protein, partial [Bacteroidales bacterium]